MRTERLHQVGQHMHAHTEPGRFFCEEAVLAGGKRQIVPVAEAVEQIQQVHLRSAHLSPSDHIKYVHNDQSGETVLNTRLMLLRSGWRRCFRKISMRAKRRNQSSSNFAS